MGMDIVVNTELTLKQVSYSKSLTSADVVRNIEAYPLQMANTRQAAEGKVIEWQIPGDSRVGTLHEYWCHLGMRRVLAICLDGVMLSLEADDAAWTWKVVDAD